MGLLSALKEMPFPQGMPRDVHVAMEAATAAVGPEEGRMAEEASQAGSEDDSSDDEMPVDAHTPAAPAAPERQPAERQPRSVWAKGKAKGTDRDPGDERRRSRSRSQEREREEAALLEEIEDGCEATDTELAAMVRRLRQKRSHAS